MDRLFLDANVLFTAAHNPGGKAAFLFDEQTAGAWQLISSGFAIEEARRNVAAKQPGHVERLGELLENVVEVPEPALRGGAIAIELPDKDLPIFVAALAARATHLLTGDLKHFGQHMNSPDKTGGILIQTVADYLARAGSARG